MPLHGRICLSNNRKALQIQEKISWLCSQYSIFFIFQTILPKTKWKKSKTLSLPNSMLSLEIFLLFLSEIFCCWQNFVFLIWYSGIVTAKAFFLFLYSGIVYTKNFNLKTTKSKFLLSKFSKCKSKKRTATTLSLEVFLFSLSEIFCCTQKFVPLIWYSEIVKTKFFFWFRYSGIVYTKKFDLKTTKWKFLLRAFSEYKSTKKKKKSGNIESGIERKLSIT